MIQPPIWNEEMQKETHEDFIKLRTCYNFLNNQKERIDNKEWKECFNLIVMNPSIHNHNNSLKKRYKK